MDNFHCLANASLSRKPLSGVVTPRLARGLPCPEVVDPEEQQAV